MFPKKRWKFTLKENYVYTFPIIPNKNNQFDFYDKKGNKWLSIFPNEGFLIVYKNYSWDGASPKFNLFGFNFGTWDGKINNGIPETYYATLIHDVLCQFFNIENFPFSLDQIDNIFYKMLKDINFKYASMYYKAVKLWHLLTNGESINVIERLYYMSIFLIYFPFYFICIKN